MIDLADLADLPSSDEASAAAVAARAADILRPQGALAKMDELAVWIAGWQQTATPRVIAPAALIFAGDHGHVSEGTSAYPQEVTRAMVDAFGSGVSTINAMARHVGATVSVVDVGVGRPTGNIAEEPALTAQRARSIVEQVGQAVAGLDADLLVLGEMGIGNTTAAAAVCAAVLGGRPGEWVGRGTGVDDDGLARKANVVERALRRAGSVSPIDALVAVGGSELLALAAGIVAARRRRLPVLLDGFVVGAAAAALARAEPAALEHCRAAHRSAEAAHGRLLEALALEPLLDLDMRLGEASGAMAAVPLVAMACACVTEVPTFGEYFGEA